MIQKTAGFFFILFITICAWEDLRYRRIRIIWYILFGLIGICLNAAQESIFWSWMTAAWPGGVLLILSKLTDGAIGTGDAWLIIVSAFYINAGQLLLIVGIAFFLSFIWALFLCVLFMIQGRNAAKKNMPFAAFFLFACILLI